MYSYIGMSTILTDARIHGDGLIEIVLRDTHSMMGKHLLGWHATRRLVKHGKRMLATDITQLLLRSLMH